MNGLPGNQLIKSQRLSNSDQTLSIFFVVLCNEFIRHDTQSHTIYLSIKEKKKYLKQKANVKSTFTGKRTLSDMTVHLDTLLCTEYHAQRAANSTETVGRGCKNTQTYTNDQQRKSDVIIIIVDDADNRQHHFYHQRPGQQQNASPRTQPDLFVPR